jgi:type II secretory ATPase GspE/PulE/Tfp pilus assembly ATPase PilB-like protein
MTDSEYETNTCVEQAIPTPIRSCKDVMHQIGQVLVSEGHVAADRLEELEHRAQWLDEPLDRIIRREDVVPQIVLLNAASTVTGIPACRLGQLKVDAEAVATITSKLAEHYRIMPLSLSDGALTVATYRIYDVSEEDQLRVVIGRPLRWVLAPSRDISESIKHYYGVGIGALLGPQGGDESQAGDDGATTPSNIVHFVEEVLTDAIRSDATDVHFEPSDNALRLRYRIDGVLDTIALPRGVEQHRRAIVSSIKVLAQLDIAEKRLPKDGRFSFEVDDSVYDMRVSVLPTRYGEAINLRVLNSHSTLRTWGELGINEAQRDCLEDLTAQPHGMVIFAGPTGSGKTTSLYATLARLNDEARKIITIEDPVEYQIKGITQLQVHPEIGFNFASGLRSVLRHDPDVILVGEIRDEETARIAMGAALTGHLVLSTLHTNDSVSAIPRLVDMGVEPYLVATSVAGVVAQRLVRLICKSCKTTIPIDDGIRNRIQSECGDTELPERFHEGRGCPDCRFTGYRGRRAILEILVIDEALRSLAAERVPSALLLERAIKNGLIPLRNEGWQAAIDGDTTVFDVLRVTRRMG